MLVDIIILKRGCHATGHSPTVASSENFTSCMDEYVLDTYIVIYKHGVQKRGKDTSLGSSSGHDASAGHNTVHVDNCWPLQKKVKNPVTHLCD